MKTLIRGRQVLKNNFSLLRKIKNLSVGYAAVVFSIVAFPGQAYSVSLSDTEAVVKIANDLANFFGGDVFKPDVTFTNNACSIDVGITGLRGVFGNGKFNQTYTGNFWEFNLRIDAAEGFAKNDRLQVSGRIQHLNDRCDLDRDEAKGSPLLYSLFLDLNNANTRSKIDDNNQILIADPRIPIERQHPVGDTTHTDILTKATLFANIFENDPIFAPKQLEIGQFQLELAARHEPRKPIPEPSDFYGPTIFGLFMGGGYLLKRKRKLKQIEISKLQ